MEQPIRGVYLVDNFSATDDRGLFVKTLSASRVQHFGSEGFFRESYYSRSKKDVIRGMHFQVPPFDHEKLVYVTEGRVVDVVLDLRLSSSTFGHHLAFTLEAFGPSLLIPRGCAHGFMVLSENATIVYNVSTEYHQTADKGILWNSFGFNWGIDKPILSERDQAFPSFGDQSYFE